MTFAELVNLEVAEVLVRCGVRSRSISYNSYTNTVVISPLGDISEVHLKYLETKGLKFWYADFDDKLVYFQLSDESIKQRAMASIEPLEELKA